MSNNQMVPVEKFLPVLANKKTDVLPPSVVSYGLLDHMHYSFSTTISDDITIHMEEAENAPSKDGFVDIEFHDTVPESYKVYYAVAAASGVVTGALSFVKLTEAQLSKVEEWKEKNWKPLIIHSAELIGCKKKDYKSASKYLVNQAVKRLKKDNSAKEYMALLTAHPTMAGLIFSMLTQFSGKRCYITESGEIILKAVPKQYYLGSSNAEKIVASVMYWMFELAANQAESKRNLIDNLGLSGELLKKIKEFVNIPFLQKIPENREQAEEMFSSWLRSIIDGAELEPDDNADENSKLVVKLMKMALNLSSDALPVLINECVVRSLYMVIRLCDVVKKRQITSFGQLREVTAVEVFPADDRLLSGMCLVASASFATINLSAAVLKGLKAYKTGDREFLQAFLAELNIPAIGRLIFACARDSKFWGDDIKVVFQRKPRESNAAEAPDEPEYDDAAFKTLSLSPAQMQLLLCLENLYVRKDIEHTEDEKLATKKLHWLQNWRDSILAGANLSPELGDEFFLEDEEKLYDAIYLIAKDKINYPWFYLLTQELALFNPYFTLGCEEDDDFRKLKVQYDYVSEQFIRKQTIVSQKELENIQNTYKKYTDYMSGKVTKTITAIAGGAAVTALTGGLALAYAPAIAAMIAGEAVLGLHGAALASASLAFVGGGSLAAGGLGMAGGTAIITGGGALIGLAGSGSTSAIVALLATSDEYWMRQSAKLLTHCKCALCDTLQQKQLVGDLLNQVEIAEKRTSVELAAIKQEDNELDKEYIKRLDAYLGCLKKVRTELQKITK